MMQVAPKFPILKENLIEQVKIGIEPEASGEILRLNTKKSPDVNIAYSIH